MQTPKKSTPTGNTCSVRHTSTLGSESDSTMLTSPNLFMSPKKMTSPNSLTPPKKGPKSNEKKFPRSPASKKKHLSRATELESQLTQLQDDLKKTKDQLAASETGKRRAQQEAEETRKCLLTLTAELEDTKNQLFELSESEDDRIQELRKLGQERDRAWQSELEAIQKQHMIDCNALVSAMNEIQRLRLELQVVMNLEAAQAEKEEAANQELHTLRVDMAETLSLADKFKSKLVEFETSEAEYKKVVNEKQIELEIAKATIEKLQSDGFKVWDSFNSRSSELEESRARVTSLEEIIRNLQQEDQVNGDNSILLCSEDELEEFLLKYEEEQAKSTIQIQSAYETLERIKIETDIKEIELESLLKEAKIEIASLRETLSDKEMQHQNSQDLKEPLDIEEMNCQVQREANRLDSELKKLMDDIMNLKANLLDKETQLQIILEENEYLKTELEKKETERIKASESTVIHIDQADDIRTNAASFHEQLKAALSANSQLEMELRKIKVQSEQWRKAAETATAILASEDNERLLERTGSMDNEYREVGGKLMNLPLYDDLDDEPQKKRVTVLKKIGVLWKKGQKQQLS